MIYTTKSFYTKPVVAKSSRIWFVFGDNQQRVGHGGQALIRDLPNAIGIATKRSCGEFMTGTLNDFEAVLRDIRNVQALTGSMVFPILNDGATSLGCGLADLPNKAPHLYGMINDWFQSIPNKVKVML